MALVPRPNSEREWNIFLAERAICTALHWHGMEREQRVSHLMPNSIF